MRCLGFILMAAALTGCSAAGLGSSQTNSCMPLCNVYPAPVYPAPVYPAAAYPAAAYAAPGYAAQTYSQTPYNQAYRQPHINQANYSTGQAGYPAVYASQPSSHAYGTHAHGQVPQLRGFSNPHSPRGYKYGNLGGILYDFDSEKFGIQGRIGYQSAGIFGAELEGSISLGSETDELDADTTAIVRGFTDPTLTPGTSTLTTEFTNSIAGFGVARLPISDRFSIHSRAGLHATRFNSELDDGTLVLRQNETSFGVAYGIGMNYSFTPKNEIRFDYTVYDNDAGGNADSLSVAVAHKF